MAAADNTRKCPKCDYAGIQGDECPKCGLIVSKYKAVVATGRPPADPAGKRMAVPASRSSVQPSDNLVLFQIIVGIIAVLIGIVIITNSVLKVQAAASIGNDWGKGIRITNETEIDIDKVGAFVAGFKRRVDECRASVTAAVQSARIVNLFGIASVLMGTWLIFSGTGKRKAVALYASAARLPAGRPTGLTAAYNTGEAYALKVWGYGLLLLSAYNIFMAVGFEVEYFQWRALYGDAFISVGHRLLLLAGHAFTFILLMAAGNCFRLACRRTPPE